jgi:hypothetical protein
MCDDPLCVNDMNEKNQYVSTQLSLLGNRVCLIQQYLQLTCFILFYSISLYTLLFYSTSWKSND